MSSNSFNKTLRSYVATVIAEPGEHKRAELSQSFLAAYPDLAAMRMTSLVEQRINDLIREMCDAEPTDQMSFFDGLPAAIAVAPGAVKAIEHCTPDDLAIGELHRRDNIASARDRLRRYQRGAKSYLSARLGGETVGDTARRLAERAA